MTIPVVTTEQLRNGNIMRQALRWIFRAVQQNCIAVPKKAGDTLPPHKIEVHAKVNGGTAQDVIDAIERNASVLAVLMPQEAVVVVSLADLKVLIELAKHEIGAPVWTIDELRQKGMDVLEAWSYYRGREIDDKRLRQGGTDV